MFIKLAGNSTFAFQSNMKYFLTSIIVSFFIAKSHSWKINVPHDQYMPVRFVNIKNIQRHDYEHSMYHLPFPVGQKSNYDEYNEEPRIIKTARNILESKNLDQDKFFKKIMPRKIPNNGFTERKFVVHLKDLVDFIGTNSRMNVEIMDPTNI